jgi:ribosomal protein S18 acetylase RimI-like enzyme
VLGAEGEIVAYVFATRDPGTGGPLSWGGRVAPAFHGLGIGGALVRWAEDLAVERAPVEGVFGLRTAISNLDTPARGLLTASGYQHVRNHWDMGADLTGDESAGDPPDGVVVRRFTDADAYTWWQVHEAAFAGHWGMEPTPYGSFAAEWFDDEHWDPSRVYLAELDGIVVGESAWVANGDGGYVATVGVVERARGRGIGFALVRTAVADIASRGLRDVELSVDTGNETGAIALYERAGLEVRREIHIFERVLR